MTSRPGRTMRVKGRFIWVTPDDPSVFPFWLRSSDIVGVRPGGAGPDSSTLMRHATTPLVVQDQPEDVLDAIEEAEGGRVLVAAEGE